MEGPPKDTFSYQEFMDNSDKLFTLTEVELAVKELSKKINKELADRELVVITIMQGGLVFSGMLIPYLSSPLQLDYAQFSRYGNEEAGGQIKMIKRPSLSLEDKIILLVDDICDRGGTLKSAKELCDDIGAKEVFAAVLAKKNLSEKSTSLIDHTFKLFYALEVPDRFVFGMGMDVKGYFRNAAGIYAVPS